MNAVTIADAEAQLGNLVQRVERGEVVTITRQGRPVARLTSAATPRQPIDLAQLRALTGTMPVAPVSAEELIRSMRDGDRF